jgi:4-hydroxybenzoate polyprenyltransferase
VSTTHPRTAARLADRQLARASAQLVRATRLGKIFPLVVVMANAALLRGRPALDCFAASALFVVVVSALGMQLNVLTDAELDRSSKPHLIRWLTGSRPLLIGTMAAELTACLLLSIAAGLRGGWPLLAGLVGYALCFTLYSYNFFTPARARVNRLKATWWGNLGAVVGGYFALWTCGFASVVGGGFPSGSWLGLALGCCLVDYGVFLNECAGDAASEREHGLSTLPALLGARTTSLIAAAILLAGVMAVIAASSAAALGRRGALAIAWHVAVQAVACLGSLRLSTRPWTGRRWEALVDRSFWLSRLGALVILLV